MPVALASGAAATGEGGGALEEPLRLARGTAQCWGVGRMAGRRGTVPWLASSPAPLPHKSAPGPTHANMTLLKRQTSTSVAIPDLLPVVVLDSIDGMACTLPPRRRRVRTGGRGQKFQSIGTPPQGQGPASCLPSAAVTSRTACRPRAQGKGRPAAKTARQRRKATAPAPPPPQARPPPPSVSSRAAAGPSRPLPWPSRPPSSRRSEGTAAPHAPGPML